MKYITLFLNAMRMAGKIDIRRSTDEASYRQALVSDLFAPSEFAPLTPARVEAAFADWAASPVRHEWTGRYINAWQNQ